MLEQQEATPPHEEPVLLSYEIQERTKRLDREVMYLLNKLRTHPPPKPKVMPTKDNSTKPTTTVSACVHVYMHVHVYRHVHVCAGMYV